MKQILTSDNIVMSNYTEDEKSILKFQRFQTLVQQYIKKYRLPIEVSKNTGMISKEHKCSIPILHINRGHTAILFTPINTYQVHDFSKKELELEIIYTNSNVETKEFYMYSENRLQEFNSILDKNFSSNIATIMAMAYNLDIDIRNNLYN